MINKYGVMQGRLLPKVEGRYQAFPLSMWQKEFHIARECKVDVIEFILDFNEVNYNPLLKEGGLDEIKKLLNLVSLYTINLC